MREPKIDRCCCTCDRNKRKDGECYCEVDGHYISYEETFEHSCQQYTLDKRYKQGGEWYNKDDWEKENAK